MLRPSLLTDMYMHIYLLFHLLQKDLAVKYDSENKGLYEYIGFEELTPGIMAMRGAERNLLANKALQYVFVGLSGFSFPVCHYPIGTCSTEELTTLTHDVISALHKHGFRVRWLNLS